MATLTAQQNYLLERLPKLYNWRKKSKPEPVAITKARQLVKNYEKTAVEIDAKLEAEAKRLITLAQEAIYFKPSGDALKMLQETEEKLAKLI